MSESLRTYKPGQKGIVRQILPGSLTPKLVEMGVYEGVELTVKYAAPLGDPIAVEVSGYLLSLRLDEADLVIMERESV